MAPTFDVMLLSVKVTAHTSLVIACSSLLLMPMMMIIWVVTIAVIDAHDDDSDTPDPAMLAMMMIAFITMKSSLVPLIEGLCAQIYFRFEISVVCSHLFLFFFVKEKTC